MKIELLVDSSEFAERLRADLGQAKSRAFVQTMSFEGDRTGMSLGRWFLACRAEDRRLLVDGYSLLVHNDCVIPGPAWRRRSFRREVYLTHRWIRRLRDADVQVRISNPPGFSPLLVLHRNHKKMAIIDDHISYIGGINFSDHNFEWHDIMFRVEHPELTRHLGEDFLGSWSGRSQPSDVAIGPFRILSLNGRGNRTGLEPVIRAIDEAKRKIDIVSPYLTPPFTDHLAHAVARGVSVRILTPALNNKPHLAAFIREAARRFGFRILTYPGRMNHTKAMVIDDEFLVVGSSNFDLVSCHFLDELVVMTREEQMVRAFMDDVWQKDVAVSDAAVLAPSLWSKVCYQAVRVGARMAETFAPT